MLSHVLHLYHTITMDKIPHKRTVPWPIIYFCILSSICLVSCNQTKEPEFECKDELGCIDIQPEEPILLGVLQALSGDIAPLGEAQIRGLKLALAKRNNTIHDHQISLQIEDTGCTSEGGANAALKIIANPQTTAIFGTTCSGAAASAAKAMSSAGLTMVSGNNSAPYLTSIGGKAAPEWYPGFFRTANNEENAGKVAAEYAYNSLNIRKAATINDNDIYTKGLTESFSKAFKAFGGTIVLDTAITKGDMNMLPVLKAVVNSGAELLFFPLFPPEGKEILLQARSFDEISNTLLMSDGALIQQKFLDTVGGKAQGMLFVGPSRPDGTKADQLEKQYIKMFDEEPAVSYFITGYDAADLLLTAIEKSAIKDNAGVLHIGKKQIRDEMNNFQSFHGASGLLSCNQFGDCGEPAFNVLRLDNPAAGLKGLESNIVYRSKNAGK